MRESGHACRLCGALEWGLEGLKGFFRLHARRAKYAVAVYLIHQWHQKAAAADARGILRNSNSRS